MISATTLVLLLCTAGTDGSGHCSEKVVAKWQSASQGAAAHDVADCLTLGREMFGQGKPWRCDSPEFMREYESGVSQSPDNY